MRTSAILALLLWGGAACARPDKGDSKGSQERLGTVSFESTCTPAVKDSVNRGVALLHDFWYEEADSQFQEIAKRDPSCAIAHWGAAMSYFHQIWDRPNETAMKRGWAEMQKAQSPAAKSSRERMYVEALSGFYKPGPRGYPARIAAYSSAMEKLYGIFPDDVDAGTFYALSILAAQAPDDTTLTNPRKALAVLTPLFATHRDHPGVVHYIIHACDTPALAQRGLAAAEHYGEIASTAPHSAHMPGHIFARLGMWQKDIEANVASVEASERAEANRQSGVMDEFHSNDFLLYAYLQSGEDDREKEVMKKNVELLDHFDAMPEMSSHLMMMEGMTGYYRTKLPVFYSLERRDWKGAAALEPVASALPEAQTLTYWARAIAAGHLRDAPAAKSDLAAFDGLIERVKKGRHAYLAGSPGPRIERGEAAAWAAFADGKREEALRQMRAAADLQDKVGQDEVDIPAREMLADMLLEYHQPKEALVEYDLALTMSPNRFNGLVNAGMAAEAAGEKARAAKYYAKLMEITGGGSQTSRPELAHAKSFLSSAQLAASQGLRP